MMEGLPPMGTAEVVFYIILAYVGFIAPVLATIGMLLLALVGLLWSPFAAAICGGVAHRKGWEGDKSAADGFLGSIFLFLPWVYMLSRLHGRPMGGGTVIAGYIMLFPLWLFGAIIPGAIMSWTLFWGGNADYGPFGALRAQYILNQLWMTSMGSIASEFAGLLLWAVMLWKMWRICRKYRQNVPVAAQGRLVAPVYMRPFQYAWLSFVLIWGFHIYIFASYPVCIVAC